ncbi:MAG: hypothetical protein GX891_01355 [Clostridiales bacterium]|mgnify:FL=1|nr:hypothetical protein [Clostridiales bacterium]
MRKLIIAAVIVLLLAVLLTGCRSATVQTGVVIDKMYGTPIKTTLGPFAIHYVSRDCYCILVEDSSGNKQWFVVDETTYNLTRIGSEFVYNFKIHEPL